MSETAPMTRLSSPVVHIWIGYCAVIWALVFALVHFLWAFGWYIGLPADLAHRAFQQPWFLAYDLVAAGAFALAGFVALALVRSWGKRLPQRVLRGVAWVGTAFLILRGAGGLIQTAYLMLTGKYRPELMQLYDIWFCLGGLLFALTLWRFRHDSTDRPVGTGHA